MSYPGNPSLSSAVKDRVVSTFQQTLALYKQGRADEVAAGCGLILQMDPQFDPARKLLDKARNPGLPINVDLLLPADGRAPIEQAREAMAARDFERVIQVTTEILTDDLMNDEARILGDEARDKMEAGPFVDQFARKCEQHITAGNLAAARADLEKARALDATHPAVVRIGQLIAQKGSTAIPPAPTYDPTPSFIVDEKPASNRGAAAASDFGFAFEEAKPQPPAPPPASTGFGGFSFEEAPAATPAAPPTPQQQQQSGGFGSFSFDSPSAANDAPFANFSFDTPAATPAAPAAPATGEFDFATAAINTSPDDQRKIEQYLTDGDRAFEAADYQQAIDLWSRIFLIDVTNEQASERIERAKAKRREIDQRVDALISTGIQAFDARDRERARAQFAAALRLDPDNSTAQDYMERLTETVAEGGAAATEAPYIAPEPDDKLGLDFFDEDALSGGDAPRMPPDPDEDVVAAEPAAKKGAAKASAKTKTKTKGKPNAALFAILALLVLGAGGWFVWSRFMSKPQTDPAATQQLFVKAESLARNGKYTEAIAMLQDVQPDDPQHDRALEMIADLQQKKSKAAQLIDGKPAAVYFQEKIDAANVAYAAHDYIAAKRAFEEAMRVRPLPPDAKTSYDAAAQQVAKLDSAKALFAERKYTEAIANLQPLLDSDPQNRSIQRMISDAHFNLGTTALQEERLGDAMREFDEVLKIDPNDELARRSRDLAQRYDGQPKDLLYRIYVKYLPPRQPV